MEAAAKLELKLHTSHLSVNMLTITIREGSSGASQLPAWGSLEASAATQLSQVGCPSEVSSVEGLHDTQYRGCRHLVHTVTGPRHKHALGAQHGEAKNGISALISKD